MDAMSRDLFMFLRSRLKEIARDYGLHFSGAEVKEAIEKERFTTKTGEELIERLTGEEALPEQPVYGELQRNGSSIYVKLDVGQVDEPLESMLLRIFSDERYPFHDADGRGEREMRRRTVYERKLISGEEIGVHGRNELERMLEFEMHEFLDRDLKRIHAYMLDIAEDEELRESIVNGREARG